MVLSALVTVDFQESDARQRVRFRREMLGRQWVNPPELEFGYCVDFQGVNSDEDVVDLAERDVAEAAEAAGIVDWDAVCVVA